MDIDLSGLDLNGIDMSGISSKLALVLPYLSYLVKLFSEMFDTLQAFFNS